MKHTGRFREAPEDSPENDVVERCLKELAAEYGEETAPYMDYEELAARRPVPLWSFDWTRRALLAGTGICLVLIALSVHHRWCNGSRTAAVIRPEQRTTQAGALCAKSLRGVLDTKRQSGRSANGLLRQTAPRNDHRQLPSRNTGSSALNMKNSMPAAKTEESAVSLKQWLDNSAAWLAFPEKLQELFTLTLSENDEKT